MPAVIAANLLPGLARPRRFAGARRGFGRMNGRLAQYRYDRSSNRQWRHDAAAHTAGVATEDQWYEYDGLYQVAEFQRGTLSRSYPNFSDITPLARNQDWNYDAVGHWLGFQNDAVHQTRQFNKVNEQRHLWRGAETAASQTRPQGGGGRLRRRRQITSINGPSGVVTPLYDPVGNMTTMPAVGNWTVAQTLKWDAWSRGDRREPRQTMPRHRPQGTAAGRRLRRQHARLVRVGEGSTILAEYTYDALFRHVTKTASGTTRRFYYSDQWQIIEEYVDSGTNPENRYWYGIRDLNDIARRQFYGATNTDLYTLRETMNVVGLADTTGAVQQRMVYDAFGAVRFLNAAFGSGANSVGWGMLYHAHYQDVETQLYQMRYRYYQANLGVWLSRDPIGELAGSNLSRFIANRAIARWDPIGAQEAEIRYDSQGEEVTFDWDSNSNLAAMGPKLPFISIFDGDGVDVGGLSPAEHFLRKIDEAQIDPNAKESEQIKPPSIGPDGPLREMGRVRSLSPGNYNPDLFSAVYSCSLQRPLSRGKCSDGRNCCVYRCGTIIESNTSRAPLFLDVSYSRCCSRSCPNTAEYEISGGSYYAIIYWDLTRFGSLYDWILNNTSYRGGRYIVGFPIQEAPPIRRGPRKGGKTDRGRSKLKNECS